MVATWEQLFLGVVVLAAGVVMLLLAYWSRRGTVPRNGLWGIRIASTQASEAAWRQSHASTWGYAAASAVVLLLDALVILLLSEPSEELLAVVALAPWVLLVPLVALWGYKAHRVALRVGDAQSQ